MSSYVLSHIRASGSASSSLPALSSSSSDLLPLMLAMAVLKSHVSNATGAEEELRACLANQPDLGLVNVTSSRHMAVVEATVLRRHPLYYKLYCVLLNTLVASLLPLVALLFLNLRTIGALKSMSANADVIADNGGRRHVGPNRVSDQEENNEDDDNFDQNDDKWLGKRLVRHLQRGSGSKKDGRRASRSNEFFMTTRRSVETIVTSEDALNNSHRLLGENAEIVGVEDAINTSAIRGRRSTSVAATGASDCRRRGSPSSSAPLVEQRLTRISVSIVWLFTFCHVWKLIPTAYEFVHSSDGLDVTYWPKVLVVVECISHTLIVFNSAVNFLIYVVH